MTVVSINQPAYLPWVGWFDRVAKSDIFIVLDHVQLEKGGFTNRTRIQQRNRRANWLTIPVEKGQPIDETMIATGTRWKWKHRRALDQAYPNLTGKVSVVEYPRLIDVLDHSTDELARLLGLDPTGWLRSSALGGDRFGVKSELVLNLCKEVEATTYLSGMHGRDYLDLPSFDKAGIEVKFHDFPLANPILSAVDWLAGTL